MGVDLVGDFIGGELDVVHEGVLGFVAADVHHLDDGVFVSQIHVGDSAAPGGVGGHAVVAWYHPRSLTHNESAVFTFSYTPPGRHVDHHACHNACSTLLQKDGSCGHCVTYKPAQGVSLTGSF